jgi:hypothetical protein
LVFVVWRRVARHVLGGGRQANGRLAVRFALTMKFEYCKLDFRRKLSSGVVDHVPSTLGLTL